MPARIPIHAEHEHNDEEGDENYWHWIQAPQSQDGPHRIHEKKGRYREDRQVGEISPAAASAALKSPAGEGDCQQETKQGQVLAQYPEGIVSVQMKPTRNGHQSERQQRKD